MAEIREYITQTRENGSISISEDVVSSIAAMAAMETEGVCGLNANLGADLADMLGKKSLGKGIRLTVGEDESIAIECYIITKLGVSVLETAKNVQKAVCDTVQSVTGLKVAAVNVTVSGILLPRETKRA